MEEETAVRKVKKETGIDIERIKLCGIFHERGKGRDNTYCLGEWIGGELMTCAESS
ncbi:ADP-ribose pyrophosphatase [Bacillus pseudomycoides]|nr:ADP-ribose pyrophosphatase [Bacillus pseudomycoides]MED1622874.1 ADP-ribose pyrophosphatase [Bacillus pseudomycoides]